LKYVKTVFYFRGNLKRWQQQSLYMY